MFIRFSNQCDTCLLTVDLCKTRAVGMFVDTDGTYFVRLSFEGSGDTVVVREKLSLADATALFEQVEKLMLPHTDRQHIIDV